MVVFEVQLRAGRWSDRWHRSRYRENHSRIETALLVL